MAEEEIAAFEAHAGLRLPAAYRDFLAQVGHGGAGPYYGLAALPAEPDPQALGTSPIVTLDPAQPAYASLRAAMEAEGDDDAVYDRLEARYRGGVLFLGEQGCGLYHALVLNGEARGRVVYLAEDIELEGRPFLCHEADFLDWYERWLDEVIAGDLTQGDAAWFGRLRGGSAAALWQGWRETGDGEWLQALHAKRALPPAILDAAEAAWLARSEDALLALLAKHDLPRARDALLSGRHGARTTLAVLSQHARNDRPLLRGWLERHDAPDETEAFRHYAYILRALDDRGLAAARLTPHVDAEDRGIRQTARYILAEMKLPTKGLTEA